MANLRNPFAASNSKPRRSRPKNRRPETLRPAATGRSGGKKPSILEPLYRRFEARPTPSLARVAWLERPDPDRGRR
jgi:hypothetical protein